MSEVAFCALSILDLQAALVQAIHKLGLGEWRLVVGEVGVGHVMIVEKDPPIWAGSEEREAWGCGGSIVHTRR